MEPQTPSLASTSWGIWGIPSRLVQGWKNWFEGKQSKVLMFGKFPALALSQSWLCPALNPGIKQGLLVPGLILMWAKAGNSHSEQAQTYLIDFFFLSLCCHPILRQDESGHIKYYQHKNISEFTGICFSFSPKRITIKFTFHINVFELFHNHEENYFGPSGEYQLCISKLAWTQNDLFTFYVSISLELIIHSADCLFKNKHTNKVQ